MLTLGIHYLTGRVVASNVADRWQVEWPPHPARVFMALAAAHFQTGVETTERSALEWLESLPAPQIHAPAAIERAVVEHYVPVNDKSGPSKAAIQSATGLTRDRQPRTFPSAWLEDDTVYVVWPDAQAETHFAALESLCRKVTRVGHSASLVQMWASQTAPPKSVNWMPHETRATKHFRVPGLGSLRYLERQFELPLRLRPELSLSQGYALRHDDHHPSITGTVFDPQPLVFALRRVDGPYRNLDLAATLQLTGRFREAVLQHIGSAPPEVLSGHSGSARSERPHIAIFPLPFVGNHGNGEILGIAVAVPRDIETSARQRLLQGLAALRREGLRLGPLGRWDLETPQEGSPLTLRTRIWTAVPRGSRTWATVTPYVFDRHAKAKDKGAYQREVADAVCESWQRVRESSDVSVQVAISPASAHLGVPASDQFPRIARKDGSECRHTHATLIFDRPIVGPVLLGAGRYRGYGLCRPLEENR